MNKPWNKQSQLRGAELRLQLKDAITSLGRRELQAQSVWTVEHLIQSTEPQHLVGFLHEVFSGLRDCTHLVRRLRYRLCAYALRTHAAKHWGQALFYVRDRVVERVGFEEKAETAQELQNVMQQLAGACIEAYCRGHYSSLGVAAKEELVRHWLSQLLIKPVIIAASRGSSKTKLSNAYLLVHGVLHQFIKWRKSSAVLYSTTDCLKEILNLSGHSMVSVGEMFLPLRSCIMLLGSRLTAAAVKSILQVITAGLSSSEDWQVRRGATDTLAMLISTLGKEQRHPAHQGALPIEHIHHSEANTGSGLLALVAARQQLLADVEQHVKYDRIPQVRAAAKMLLQEFSKLHCAFVVSPDKSPESQSVDSAAEQLKVANLRANLNIKTACKSGSGTGNMPMPEAVSSPGGRRKSAPARIATASGAPLLQANLDYGVKVYAPLHSYAQQHQHKVVAKEPNMYNTTAELNDHETKFSQDTATKPAEDLDGLPGSLGIQPEKQADEPHHIADAGFQPSSFSVVHPSFQLQLAGNPVMMTINAPSSKNLESQVSSAVLNMVKLRLHGVDNLAKTRLEVEISLLNDGQTGVANTYFYDLQGGQLVQQVIGGPPFVEADKHDVTKVRPQGHSKTHSEPHISNFAAYAGSIAAGVDALQGLHASSPSKDECFQSLPQASRGTSRSSSPAGKSSIDIGMDKAAKEWAGSLRPCSIAHPLLTLPGGPPSQPASLQHSRLPYNTVLPPAHLQEAPQQHSLEYSPSSSGKGKRGGSPHEAEQAPLRMYDGPMQDLLTPSTETRCGVAESPPCTPGYDNSGASTPCQPKGPLTAMVTKALSRLHALEDLQHWQESVSQQLSMDNKQSCQPDHSDASSVKQRRSSSPESAAVVTQLGSDKMTASLHLVDDVPSLAETLLSSLPGESDRYHGSNSGEGEDLQKRKMGLLWHVEPTLSSIPEDSKQYEDSQINSSKDLSVVDQTQQMGLLWQMHPTLSSIAEDSQRYSNTANALPADNNGPQDQQQQMGLLWQLDPTLSSIPEEVELDAGNYVQHSDDHGMIQNRMGLMWQLEQKLHASMQDVDHRISCKNDVKGYSGQGRDTILAVHESHVVGRPDSRESGLSSPLYDCSPFEGSALQIINPLFGASRPGTPSGNQQLQGAGKTGAHGTALDGGESAQPRESSASLNTASSGFHDSFSAPQRLPSSDQTLSIGAVHSIGSMGSEFAVAGHDTEEEVRSFLRGSIVSPKQYALGHRNQTGASSLKWRDTHEPGNSANQQPLTGVGHGCNGSIRHARPPRPRSASNASKSHGQSRPSSQNSCEGLEHLMHTERPRWAHLDCNSMHASSTNHEAVGPHPHVAVPAEQDALEMCLDLNAILGSCQVSPCSSVCTTSDMDEMHRISTGDAAISTEDCQFDEDGVERQRVATTSCQLVDGCAPSHIPEVRQGTDTNGCNIQESRASFPHDAYGRLKSLQIQLSPQVKAPTSSLPQKAAHASQVASSQDKLLGDCEQDAASQQNIEPRPPSPVAPGLPISQKQARILCEVVDKWQEGSQLVPVNLQSVLMEMLERHKHDVQAYYEIKQQQKLYILRQRCGENSDILQGMLQREGERLKVTSEQAARREVQRFALETLPCIADVLSSEELLLRSFQS